MRKRIKTLDEFAGMIHKDYMALDKKITGEIRAVRRDMATRAELKEVRDDVQHITETMVSKADLSNIIRDEYGVSEPAKQIEKLRVRMDRVEDELGLEEIQTAQ